MPKWPVIKEKHVKIGPLFELELVIRKTFYAATSV